MNILLKKIVDQIKINNGVSLDEIKNPTSEFILSALKKEPWRFVDLSKDILLGLEADVKELSKMIHEEKLNRGYIPLNEIVYISNENIAAALRNDISNIVYFDYDIYQKYLKDDETFYVEAALSEALDENIEYLLKLEKMDIDNDFSKKFASTMIYIAFQKPLREDYYSQQEINNSIMRFSIEYIENEISSNKMFLNKTIEFTELLEDYLLEKIELDFNFFNSIELDMSLNDYKELNYKSEIIKKAVYQSLGENFNSIFKNASKEEVIGLLLDKSYIIPFDSTTVRMLKTELEEKLRDGGIDEHPYTYNISTADLSISSNGKLTIYLLDDRDYAFDSVTFDQTDGHWKSKYYDFDTQYNDLIIEKLSDFQEYKQNNIEKKNIETIADEMEDMEDYEME